MKNKNKIISVIAIIVLVLIIWIGEGFLVAGEGEGDLEIHFIDVGQGDSILIKEEDEFMLIDGGKRADGDTVVKYLKEQNVESLKYVIGTHPHEDHIGGLKKVVDRFQIENVIMPDITHNTKVFEDVLDSVINKGLSIIVGRAGDKYSLKDADILFLAPNGDKYSSINDYSISIKIEYGKTSFLFPGDAEKTSENEMIENYSKSLKSDVLKLGHHGSNTSTTEDFLNEVNPSIGVISVGKDNKYNHPNKDILERLDEKDIKVFRTDVDGDIIIKSDKSNIILQDGSSINGVTDSILREISKVKDRLIDNLIEDI
ncbi:MAG TPA: ComEC/Rec2 family competence protein [Tissierellaceae bacterium]|nr:ComEC/Rec2 family competence protein [Tissierellaceae bacterium]